MRMKSNAAVAAFALAAAVVASADQASAEDPEFSANFGVVSDYVFRGFSQSDENVAVQGGADMTVGSFYAGTWASTVDFGDDTGAEVDIYGGYRTEAAGFAWDFGVVGYLYPGAPTGADYDYVEFKAAASRAFGPATLGGAVYYSPDFFGAVDDEAIYSEASAAFAVTDKVTISGAVGFQYLDFSDDYTTWNLGATYALTDGIGIDVRYHDTDVDDVTLAEDRIVAGLKFSF